MPLMNTGEVGFHLIQTKTYSYLQIKIDKRKFCNLMKRIVCDACRRAVTNIHRDCVPRKSILHQLPFLKIVSMIAVIKLEQF